MTRRAWIAAYSALLTLVPFAGRAAAMASQMQMPVPKLSQVTSVFGERHDGFHPGIDLAAPYGSPVVAAEPGMVISTRRDPGYGNVLDLRDARGAVTRYAHLASFAPAVRGGTRLERGAVLGAIGETGKATGPHLHFEYRIAGTAVDPAPYVFGAATRPLVVPASARSMTAENGARQNLAAATSSQRRRASLVLMRRPLSSTRMLTLPASRDILHTATRTAPDVRR